MRIIIETDKYIEDFIETVNKCVNDFVCLYNKLMDDNIVVSVAVER